MPFTSGHDVGRIYEPMTAKPTTEDDLVNDVMEDLVRRATANRAETLNRAVERMLILPGNLGVRAYEWIDADGYHCAGYLTDEVEHMTIESMPFGTTPTYEVN